MKIVETIKKDEEIQELKKKYKEKFNKNAPPYHYNYFNGLKDYKEQLRKLVNEK